MSFLLGFWNFATSRVGSVLMAGAFCLALGFGQGWSTKAKLDRSATLRSTIAKQRIDLDAAKESADAANATIAIVAARDADNQEIIRGLKGNSCKLDDAGARWLRSIK